MVEFDILVGAEPPLDLNESLVQQWLDHYDLLVASAGHIGVVSLALVSRPAPWPVPHWLVIEPSVSVAT